MIESLVGRSFLPRGTGIVTRRPLICQLIYCPLSDKEYRSEVDGTSDLAEWGVFLHRRNIYTNFDEIRKEIEKETERIAGANKGISSEPITLKIYSTNVVNLTFVDLPGMTKVPVGDQPSDIEEQIMNLVELYVTNPNSIILAISAANTDLANSEALKLGFKVDPDGERTLALLTKLDLMDKGTNASEELSGKVIPVKLGIIGVVNRSQQAVNKKQDFKIQQELESKFFNKNYPKLAHKNGSKYLAKTLNELLIKHIRKCLPDLTERINKLSREKQDILDSYGKAVDNESQTLIRIILKFSQAYSKKISGNFFSFEHESTKLYKIVHESFRDEVEFIDPKFNISEKIDESLNQPHGARPTIFQLPFFDIAFERLARENIDQLLQPSKDCVKMVQREMERAIVEVESDVKLDFKRFPLVKQKIFEEMANFIEKNQLEAMNHVENLIKVELAYINKLHPDFNPLAVIDKDDRLIFLNKMTLEKKKEVLKKLVFSYYFIVRKTLLDLVPKTIMHFLVNYVQENIQGHLIESLSEKAKEIVIEDKDIEIARHEATTMLEALNRSTVIMRGISEFGSEWESFGEKEEEN